MYFPSIAKRSAMAKVQKAGYRDTRATPHVNTPIPTNIPNLRPRRAAIGAKSGLVIPVNERMVINNDMAEILTPRPRAKTDKKGYTILCAVFRMVRENIKMMS